MSIPLTIRRVLVVSGVFVSLAIGVASLRDAAARVAMTSASDSEPAGMTELQAQLGAGQSRSAALQAELRDLTVESANLAKAVETAAAVVGSDAATAGQLRASLVDAQQALASLDQPGGPVTAAEPPVRKPTAAKPSPGVEAPSPVATSPIRRHHDQDDDEHDDD